MQLTQYCIKCGHKMELDFGRRKKRHTCKACKLHFKYWEGADGALSYDYNPKQIENLYVDNMRLIDIAKHNTEVMKEVPILGGVQC